MLECQKAYVISYSDDDSYDLNVARIINTKYSRETRSISFELDDFENEDSLRTAIASYLDFYNTERLQERFENQTPMQVRQAALNVEIPHIYPIEENKRIIKYKQHLKELSVSI